MRGNSSRKAPADGSETFRGGGESLAHHPPTFKMVSWEIMNPQAMKWTLCFFSCISFFITLLIEHPDPSDSFRN